MSYGNPSNRSSADIPVTVFTSLLTSLFVTVGVLYFTGNLLPEASKPEPSGAPPTPADPTVSAPALKGLSTPVAGEVLRARELRLVVQEERPDDTVQKGHVIEQDPLPESELRAGGAVAVVVSSGPPADAAVPMVAGKTVDEARQALTEAGFTVGEIIAIDVDPSATAVASPGAVVETAPPMGERAPGGAAVRLKVAKSVVVPKLIGQYLPKARKTLSELGLRIEKIRWADSEDWDSNVVLAQEPEPDAVVLPNAGVTLRVNAE